MTAVLKKSILLVAFVLIAAAAAPAAGRKPVVIAPSVRVGGVVVGGLTSEPARARLDRAFTNAIPIRFGKDSLAVSPAHFGTSAAVNAAVSAALQERAGGKVAVRVRLEPQSVDAYVVWLARRYRRAPVNARVSGVDPALRPVIAPDKPGVVVRQAAMRHAIVRALQTGSRKPLKLIVKAIPPKLTRAHFGPVIVISRGGNALRLFNGRRFVQSFGVATGRAQYPTPSGIFAVVDMQRDPWWRPPHSDWAKGLKPIPPGPGNPLGTRWMGLSAPGVGIHGTPDDSSIGYSASHGCIRMHIPDAAWLFEHVHMGTPVVIV